MPLDNSLFACCLYFTWFT